MKATSNHIYSVVLTCVLAMSQMACEELVDSANRSEFGFTVYGVINPTADSQAVRVFPIEALLDVTRPEPIDALVTSVDLTTGEEHEWRDSLTWFNGNVFGHVFWKQFRAEYEHSYRLEILRSDGVRASVSTTVPPLVEPVVEEPDPDIFDLMTLVSWTGAPQLIDIRVTYTTNAGVFVTEYGVQQETIGDAQVVKVQFREDTREPLFVALIARISPVTLSRVKIEAVVASDDWVPPGGAF